MLLWINAFVFRFQIISSWDTVNTASGLILRTFREKFCHRVIYEYFCMKKLQNVVEIVHNNVQKVWIDSLHSNFWKKFIKMWFFSPKNPYPALNAMGKSAWVQHKNWDHGGGMEDRLVRRVLIETKRLDGEEPHRAEVVSSDEWGCENVSIETLGRPETRNWGELDSLFIGSMDSLDMLKHLDIEREIRVYLWKWEKRQSDRGRETFLTLRYIEFVASYRSGILL